MKKLSICLAVLAASFTQVSFAGTVSNAKPAVCANSADCSINGVALSGSVTAKVEGRASQLKLVGAGLRQKTIVVVPVNVYVVQFYANDPSKISRTSDGILASLDTQQTVAMTLTFRRDVNASQIQDAFQEGFDANGVDTTSNQVATLLDYALKSGVAKTGQVMTFVGEYFADGTTAVTFESAQGNAMTIKGDKNFVRQVMSLWLGTTADSGLESAKKDILRDRKIK
jgi:hypothetical protein